MKMTFTAASLLLFFLGHGAAKTTNKITLQAHDENLMMGIMHDMMDMEMTVDPAQDFTMVFKMHHQVAIKMANAELKDGRDA